ncbi:hypothetical protein ANCCAN_07733 [Ancylostoma caninum]|uniref:Uncharacterized protein n=1 Tax=Ancylostoma caninum TaxID=29170 RepID=A0A368GPG8_ANCCA|nr:hypothetical protein ANCCAN_07733 [Ancylostoma caninum]
MCWNFGDALIQYIVTIPCTQPAPKEPYHRYHERLQEWHLAFQFIRPSLPLFSSTQSIQEPASRTPPPAAPRFLPNAKHSLVSGVKRWSPMLGRRLATLLISVEEQLAEEVTQKILHEALTETMATLREVNFYRFYHVFRKGELENLVNSIPSLVVVRSSFEHGNWCVVVEKQPKTVT